MFSDEVNNKRGGRLNKTQNLQRDSGMTDKQRTRASAGDHAPGSRRELNQNKPLTGGTLHNRPGTAPQSVGGLLQSASTKPNRPMSPFTKVYQNQLASNQQRK